MPEFPHLPLPKKISAPFKYVSRPINIEKSPVTERNLAQRSKHAKGLTDAVDKLSTRWQENITSRKTAGLPDLELEAVIPLLISVDRTLFSPDDLFSFGIDVVAENEDGSIIGAATDNFISLKKKLSRFAQNANRSGKPAQIWEISDEIGGRLTFILSPELLAKWDQLDDLSSIYVDVSIACNIKIPPPPSRINEETDENFRKRMGKWMEKRKQIEAANANLPAGKRKIRMPTGITRRIAESEDSFNSRYNDWLENKQILESHRQDLFDARESDFLRFISSIGAVLISSIVYDVDSFGCRLDITGKALKDLVWNYQYIFDVTEYDNLKYTNSLTGEEQAIDLELNPPDENAPAICVIDSGIQEGHKLLSPAILSKKSKSYLIGDETVFDQVGRGGHGTKVAGAVLYGTNIPKEGVHDLDFWICNARVLNDRNVLPSSLFPPAIMESIVNDFPECRIFNLSISGNTPSRTLHMSRWATTLDKLAHSNDRLFIIAAGNLLSQSNSVRNPGIRQHLVAGRGYPEYLLANASRIADPAQSCFGITVGSICASNFEDVDRMSFGKAGDPSAFTRCGPGIWRMIKPDVVEYGGDFVREKQENPNITQHFSCAVEVVKTTSGGGNAVGFDTGTSYAAPKVSHIAGKVQKMMPQASSNLLRALIVQSARLPEPAFFEPTINHIRYFGYGIPSVDRATSNHEGRITLISEGRISAKEAQIFTVVIPEEIRRTGQEYDILIEVSLAYTAIPRRTRRRTNSYLSTWVDWQSSKFEEPFEEFKSRVTQVIEEEDVDTVENVREAEGAIQWKIRENNIWGSVKGLRRQDSGNQKDWTIIRSFSMPREFSIAVIGHKGWEKDVLRQVPFAIAVSFEILNAKVNLYDLIRIENEIEVEELRTI